MNEEIWFLENQFHRLVMDNDRHGFWLLPKEPEKLLIMKEEEDKDWERCKLCGMKTKSHWYRTTKDCTCPGGHKQNDPDQSDCECEEVEEEGIFCGYCGEYHKGE